MTEHLLTPDERAEYERLRAQARSGPHVIDEDGAPAEPAAPAAEVAIPDDPYDVALADEQWSHDTIEFAGETYHVRRPSDQALTGFALASSKYVPEKIKADIVGLFMRNHLSPASFVRLWERLLDPEDVGMTPESVGELMAALAKLGRD